MLRIATTFSTWMFSAFGALSLFALGCVGSYMLLGLLRRRRIGALVVAVLVLAAATTVPGIWLLSIACGLLVTAQALAYAWFAFRSAVRSAERRTWTDAPPTIAVVVPAKDEAAVIGGTLAALDGLEHPVDRLEIVVIDDGSTDTTSAVAERAALAMRHRVRIVRFEDSAGKARRVNELVRTLASEFVLLLDADHRPEPGLIARMLGNFAARPDVGCVQVASTVRNGGANALTKALELEYSFRCRGIYPGKPCGIFVGSGGMFRRSVLLAVGGFDPHMLTEDVEISYRLYKHGLHVAYDDSVSTYDLAPLDFRNFFNQRRRWMRGVWQALLTHLREPGAGLFPAVMPYFVQFTCDGLGALGVCVLEALFFLDRVHVIHFGLSLPIHLFMASASFGFGVGFVRGRSLRNALFLPLVPFYMIAHTIPMAWALIESYVLDEPAVWVKTERVSDARTSARLSGGRA